MRDSCACSATRADGTVASAAPGQESREAAPRSQRDGALAAFAAGSRGVPSERAPLFERFARRAEPLRRFFDGRPRRSAHHLVGGGERGISRSLPDLGCRNARSIEWATRRAWSTPRHGTSSLHGRSPRVSSPYRLAASGRALGEPRERQFAPVAPGSSRRRTRKGRRRDLARARTRKEKRTTSVDFGRDPSIPPIARVVHRFLRSSSTL